MIASLFVSLFLVVTVEVTVLAHFFGVYQLVLVWTHSGKTAPAIQVVAMVAHALRIVLHLRVRAPSDRLFTPKFRLLLRQTFKTPLLRLLLSSLISYHLDDIENRLHSVFGPPLEI